MMSMGMQRDGASPSIRLQPNLSTSSLGLTPVLGSTNDMRGFLADGMACLKNCENNI